METYTPANSINKDSIISSTDENHDIKILRDANRNFKLEIIDLKQKLKAIYSLLTDNKDNLIQE
tara:strand:+ start:233 stop:424 length:192 start_codon:yes stop_codon:yes gene_type:complete